MDSAAVDFLAVLLWFSHAHVDIFSDDDHGLQTCRVFAEVVERVGL